MTIVIHTILRASLKKGVGKLTQPATANNYARQPALINRVGYWMFIQRLAITGFVSLLAPSFQVFRNVGFVARAEYKSFLASGWGAVAGL